MKGYYLFRGDTLIAYNEPNEYGLETAHGLHKQGQLGDILVRFPKDKTVCFDWAEGSYWDNERSHSTDKYKALILLQK